MNLNADLVEKIIERSDFTESSLLDISYLDVISIEPNAFEMCRSRRIRSLNLIGKREITTRRLCRPRIPVMKFEEEHLHLFEPFKEH